MVVPKGLRFCRALLYTSVLRPSDLEDLTGMDRPNCRVMLSQLVQTGALKRNSVGYVKTSAFIALLKSIKQQDFKSEVPI